MEGDREKCLKSGMDNYFTKPLKKDLMQDMLAKYLTPTMIAQSDKSEIPVDGFDQQLFYSYKRIMGNKFDKSIGCFFEDSKIMLSKLKEAHEKQDLQELSTIAHTLKSTSAAIGAVEFSDIALSLEKEARKRITNGQSDTPLPNHIIERLKTSFNEIEQKIEKLGLCCRND